MTQLSRKMLLSLASLAAFCFLGFAPHGAQADQPSQQRSTDAENKLASLFQVPPATNDDEIATVATVSHSRMFVDDGWQGASIGDGGEPDSCDARCENCSDDICDTEVDCGDGCCDSCGKDPAKKRKITVDVELLAQRTHFGEDAVGKLAEKYELAEKLTLGIENEMGMGGRIRYWTYDRTTPNLGAGSDLRADFDVIDFEGTTRFGTSWFDLTLSSGIRWADIKIDIDSGRSRNDMPGGCFGLDVRGLMCHDKKRGLMWRSVSGVRWSIFGGDWELQNGLIEYTRDDNITVSEIYGGLECTKCGDGPELYARLVFEAQNWRSDALGEATGVDSITFIGPGVNLGVNF